ncbi:MAG TPA: APC family permease, partial [Gemmatimonadales bacterium]|nr:APC family permease [Gemmatimonadales bacterium]
PRGSAGGPRPLGLIPLVGLIYCLSTAGPFGLEEMVPESGPGLTLLLNLLLPILYGLPLGLASGEMGSRFPVEGGYYRWVRRIFGDFWGFQTGWWSWLGACFDGALYAVLVAEYSAPILAALVPAPYLGVARQIVCLVVVVVCTWANLRGIELVGWSSFAFTLFMLSPFAVMCALGLLHWHHNPLVPFTPPGTGWGTAMGAGVLIGMWGYSGYESLSTAAEEIEDPRRNYLKAILIVLILTIPTNLMPILITLAVTGDWTHLTAGSFADVGRVIGGAPLGFWIAAAGIVSNLALFNAYTLSYSRLPFAMAQDGFAPRWLARTHRKYGTPWAAILVGAVTYAALTFLSARDLIVLEMWLYSVIYILIYLVLFRLRLRPDLDPGGSEGTYRFIIPLGRWGIWLVIGPPIALTLYALWNSEASDVKWGGTALLSGVAIYALILLFRRVRGRSEPAGHPGGP